ncbi:aldo/keto reductase [Streptosporangium soli]|nr:aldo/keto reductase [Streptosporangium sp. KLBMP 9127]
MTSNLLANRTLGRTGITVPALGVGCWAIGGPDHNLGMPMGWSTGADERAAIAGLETAWELGARLYDTADVYGHGLSERRLGHLIAQVPREQVVLSSKVGYFAGTAAHGFDPAHMRRQLGQTLDNLGTSHLEIYGLHHHDFGEDDRWLDPAIEAMHALRSACAAHTGSLPTGSPPHLPCAATRSPGSGRCSTRYDQPLASCGVAT